MNAGGRFNVIIANYNSEIHWLFFDTSHTSFRVPKCSPFAYICVVLVDYLSSSTCNVPDQASCHKYYENDKVWLLAAPGNTHEIFYPTTKSVLFYCNNSDKYELCFDHKTGAASGEGEGRRRFQFTFFFNSMNSARIGQKNLTLVIFDCFVQLDVHYHDFWQNALLAESDIYDYAIARLKKVKGRKLHHRRCRFSRNWSTHTQCTWFRHFTYTSSLIFFTLPLLIILIH